MLWTPAMPPQIAKASSPCFIDGGAGRVIGCDEVDVAAFQLHEPNMRRPPRSLRRRSISRVHRSSSGLPRKA